MTRHGSTPTPGSDPVLARLRQHYTTVACGDFAAAVVRARGGTLRQLWRGRHPVHTVAALPDGRLVDVTGVVTVAGLATRFQAPAARLRRPQDPDSAAGRTYGAGQRAADRRADRALARLVAAGLAPFADWPVRPRTTMGTTKGTTVGTTVGGPTSDAARRRGCTRRRGRP